ncbi:MAG: DUF2332 family protein [Polyangiaceae bacterium]
MRGLDGFEADAEEQAQYFETHAHPTYADLLRALGPLFAEHPQIHARIAVAWKDREFHANYERPLLFLAALRRDAQARVDHPLRSVLGDAAGGSESVDRGALALALGDEAPLYGALRDRFVQTNEVTRAIAWRLPLTRFEGEEVALVDLGCSAGLNLVADRAPVWWVDGNGHGLYVADTGRIEARIGLDRAPVDLDDEDELAWLRACLWPGQHERRTRFDAAVDAAKLAISKGEMSLHAMEAAEMPAWLERYSEANPGLVVLAFQTVLAEYLPPEVRRVYVDGMKAWLAGDPQSRLWAELERAEDGRPGPAELRAHFGDQSLILASCEYHPSVVNIDQPKLDELLFRA